MIDIEPLVKAGLTNEEAIVYATLLDNGNMFGKNLVTKTPYKKGLVYKSLQGLIDKKLIRRQDRGTRADLFIPEHPRGLEELLLSRKKKINSAESELSESMGSLISSYNLVSEKPGVRFLEGSNGVRKAIFETLRAQGEIRQYGDIEAIVRYIPEINKEYAKRRDRKGIKKRGIGIDTPFARSFLSDYLEEITDTKLIKRDDAIPFESLTYIYDNKVIFVSLSEQGHVATILEDPRIFRTQAYIFDMLWDQAEFLSDIL